MSTRLQRDWLSDPQFSCWISGIPGDAFVYCKLCNKDVNLYNGKSSLRSHATGVRHSDLEKAFKRKRKNTSKTTSSRSSANAKKPLTHGSQTAKVNINLINAPGTSAVPDVHQSISSFDKNRMYSASSYGMSPAATVLSLRRHQSSSLWLPTPSLVSSSGQSNRLFDSSISNYYDEQLEQFKQDINQMFIHQGSSIANASSSFLAIYRPSLSSRKYDKIQQILKSYKTSAEHLRKNIEQQLTVAFLE